MIVAAPGPRAPSWFMFDDLFGSHAAPARSRATQTTANATARHRNAAQSGASGTADAFLDVATGTRRVCAAAFTFSASSPVPEETRPPAALRSGRKYERAVS
jgi:hypothetical protein